MTAATAEKIGNTRNSFPAQKPGAVAECPFKAKVAEKPAAPVGTKTAQHLTQEILKSLGAGKAAEKPKEKKAWIEIVLLDMDGKPVPGVKYRITPPGSGAPKEGKLNEFGQAGVYQIEPGNCKITFPDLDQEAWD